MNTKKLIIVGAALLAAGLTYGQSRGTVERGLLGAVMGGVIGNNVGDGDSETGAIIGGLLIGLGEKLAEIYIGGLLDIGAIENWFAYFMALVFLLFRPQGLFGDKIIERV